VCESGMRASDDSRVTFRDESSDSCREKRMRLVGRRRERWEVFIFKVPNVKWGMLSMNHGSHGIIIGSTGFRPQGRDIGTYCTALTDSRLLTRR
jgi:hypothetical protein